MTVLGLISCDKEEMSNSETDCEQDLLLEPVCSFDPTVLTTVPFPIWVLIDGVQITSTEYTFVWSSDADFTGSAISATYDQLPLTVTVTEKSTDCVGEATLTADYWQ